MVGQTEDSYNIALGHQSLTAPSSTQYVHPIQNEGLTPKSKFPTLEQKGKKTFHINNWSWTPLALKGSQCNLKKKLHFELVNTNTNNLKKQNDKQKAESNPNPPLSNFLHFLSLVISASDFTLSVIMLLSLSLSY